MTDTLEAILPRLPEQPRGEPVSVAGGCIHSSWKWGPFFLKINDLSRVPHFHAEAEGLRALAETRTIRVPNVILRDTTDTHAFLVLEALDLTADGDESALGEQLAALHHHTAEHFGFADDNFIGDTPQPNPWHRDWTEFFRKQRLGFLLDRLAQRGIRFPESRSLLDHLPEILPRTDPTPSLLHGDLWAGNKAFLPDGTPVVFDPACHYGHAACDLAMTRLFGGFSRRFYESYAANTPAEWHETSGDDVYTLYHILNHALLFGCGYTAQARALIQRLLN